MPNNRIEWKSVSQKREEWGLAKELLSPNGILLPDGTKLRRKDSGLEHSFIIVGGKILAMSGKGVYLGEGAEGKVKIAEDEFNKIYALKIIRNLKMNISDEGRIALDLNQAHGESIRQSASASQNINNKKHYLAYEYLGISLHEYLNQFDWKSYRLHFMDSQEMEELRAGIKPPIDTNCFLTDGEELIYCDMTGYLQTFLIADGYEAEYKDKVRVIVKEIADNQQKNSLNLPIKTLKRLLEYVVNFDASAFRESHLPDDKRYELAIKAALALHALHTGKNSANGSRYIHSDVHFSNITIDEREQLHFIDYGRSYSFCNNSSIFFDSSWDSKFSDFQKKDVWSLLIAIFDPLGINKEWLLNARMCGSNKNLKNLFECSKKQRSIESDFTAVQLAKKLTLIRLKLDDLPFYNQVTNDPNLEMVINKLNESSVDIHAVNQFFDALRLLFIENIPQQTLIDESLQIFRHYIIAYAHDNKAEINQFAKKLHDNFESLTVGDFISPQKEKLESILNQIRSNALLVPREDISKVSKP